MISMVNSCDSQKNHAVTIKFFGKNKMIKQIHSATYVGEDRGPGDVGSNC